MDAKVLDVLGEPGEGFGDERRDGGEGVCLGEGDEDCCRGSGGCYARRRVRKIVPLERGRAGEKKVGFGIGVGIGIGIVEWCVARRIEGTTIEKKALMSYRFYYRARISTRRSVRKYLIGVALNEWNSFVSFSGTESDGDVIGTARLCIKERDTVANTSS